MCGKSMTNITFSVFLREVKKVKRQRFTFLFACLEYQASRVTSSEVLYEPFFLILMAILMV